MGKTKRNIAKIKAPTMPPPPIIRKKGKLLAYVLEVEGERVEVPAEKVSVYTSTSECDLCGYHTSVELSFNYDVATNSYIENITIQDT
jgi:hypothetical protein